MSEDKNLVLPAIQAEIVTASLMPPEIRIGGEYRLVLENSTGVYCILCGSDVGADDIGAESLEIGVVMVIGIATGSFMECAACGQKGARTPPGWYIVLEKIYDGNPLPIAVPGEWLKDVNVVDGGSQTGMQVHTERIGE